MKKYVLIEHRENNSNSIHLFDEFHRMQFVDLIESITLRSNVHLDLYIGSDDE